MKKSIISLFLLLIIFYSNTCVAEKLFGNSSENKKDSLLYPPPGKAYIIQLSTKRKQVLPENYDELLRYNYYGISWNKRLDDNLKFSKQMGYKYVFYQPGMENNSLASDLYFYLETPEYDAYSKLGLDRAVSPGKKYSEAQIKNYEKYFALKDTTSAFPENLAKGWTVRESFCVEPDFQQQRVIDYFTEKVLEIAVDKENKEKKFLFGGFAYDVPEVTGLFYIKGKMTPLSFWTGKDSTARLRGTVHNYNTYHEGKTAYLINAKKAATAKFPDRKLNFIYEPYGIYAWVRSIEKLDYSIQSDLFSNAMIAQESGNTPWSTGTEFVDDQRMFKSGLITKERTCSDTPDNHDLMNNIKFGARAAINGSWFNWFGRITGRDNKPWREIRDVPNWLQLIRVVANWDNLNGLPLKKRSSVDTVYTSPNSRMDRNIIYSRQPKTQKLFVVFLNNSAELKLKPGEKIESVMRVDSLFCETVDGRADLLIKRNKIKLK
jgi:hypothetical protein